MTTRILPLALILAANLCSGAPSSASPEVLERSLPLPGEVFRVQGRTAFVIFPQTKSTHSPFPWVWYAPTLPGLPGNEEKWMFERFSQAGVAIAGIDVGESYGSPDGRALYSAFYDELTQHRGFAPKAVLLGRSRGGLMTLSWAAENPDKVAGFAGIYPVCSIASYPGVTNACAAYHMTAEELSARLAEHNPIGRLAALAKAGVPLFAIHGDSDKVVPLEANSGEMRTRYEALGGRMQLLVPPGQGHSYWPGFFQCQELVDFVLSQAKRTKPKPPETVQLGGAWGAALARGVERLAREPYTTEEWLLADITDKIRRYPNNYSGDVPGRYIELAVLTSAGQPFSPPLVSNVLAALPGLQKPDGHFGVDLDLAKPTDATSPLYPMLWGNGRLLIGLPVAARATGDPRLWEAARRLGDFYVNSAAQLCSPAREAEFRATGTYGVGYTCCYFPAIEGLALLYQDTGEERYLRQAERMAEVFNKFDALPIDHSHGNLCAWRGILALYEITGKRAYLLGAQAKWEQAMQGGYVWPLGGIGEHFYKDYSGDEGCSESDWLRFNLELWRFTGETRYLEIAERLLHNQYAANQCPNGGYGWRNFDSDGVGPVATRGKVDEWNVCCNFHGPLGLHYLKACLAVGITNRILVNFLTDFSASVRAGQEEWRVSVKSVAATSPAERVFDLALDPKPGSATSGTVLWLRVPSWSTQLVLKDSSGRKLPLTSVSGYVQVDCSPKSRHKLRVICREALAVEDRRFRPLQLKPGQVSRLNEVVLTLGPEVLFAAPAVGQGRPTLLMMIDEAGRLSAPVAEKGRLYTWRLPQAGMEKAQLPAAIAQGTPLALRPWPALNSIRRAAFVCDLVVVPARDIPRAARKALRQQAAAVAATLTGPFFGQDLDQQPDLWAAPAGWHFTREGLRIEGGEVGLFLGELPDYRLEFDLTLPAQGDGITGWIVRAQDANNCLMFQIQSSDSPVAAPEYKTRPNTLRPHVRRNGAWTVMDPVPLPRKVLRGETHRFRVDCRGHQIEVFLDGELVHSQSDAGFSRGTIGLRAASPAEQGLFRHITLTAGLAGKP